MKLYGGFVVKHNAIIKLQKGGFVMEQVTTENTTEKRVYSVPEIMEVLGISRNKAYELCNSNAFRTVRIGTCMRVSKSSFDAWLDNKQ